MSTRVNARLEPELARKFERLQAQTGKSATEVLQASIEAYFDKMVGDSGVPSLLEGFIGCASGDANLSAEYKAVLATSLEAKLEGASARRGNR